uniref:Uncharacterized protein n=1 Tax=viral metagenome TaxID=1070528 RepID=A0A6M3JKU4_9ZZZZ
MTKTNITVLGMIIIFVLGVAGGWIIKPPVEVEVEVIKAVAVSVEINQQPVAEVEIIPITELPNWVAPVH